MSGLAFGLVWPVTIIGFLSISLMLNGHYKLGSNSLSFAVSNFGGAGGGFGRVFAITFGKLFDIGILRSR